MILTGRTYADRQVSPRTIIYLRRSELHLTWQKRLSAARKIESVSCHDDRAVASCRQSLSVGPVVCSAAECDGLAEAVKVGGG